MIEHIQISNLALVSSEEFSLTPGLVTITGETGAGKSLLLGALQLLIGSRMGPGIIRRGAERCEVAATFALDHVSEEVRHLVNNLLAESGLPDCENGRLLIRRVINSSGSRAFVNGSLVTVGFLKELGDLLVDIHGPHDHQSLLLPRRQLDILDAYAGLSDETARCRDICDGITALEEKLTQAEEGTLTAEEAEVIRHQLRDIDQAEVDPEEEEQLVARHRVAADARHLVQTAGQCSHGLVAAEGCAVDALADFVKLLREIENVDAEKGGAFLQRMEGVIEALQELGADLEDYADSLDLDGEELAQLEERLDLLQRLKRRHGPSLEDVLKAADTMRTQLDAFDSREHVIKTLQNQIADRKHQLDAVCGSLNAGRSKAAIELATAISKKLRRLGFERADFAVNVTRTETPGPTGQNSAEFCFAPNPGEELLPLRQIASSGEMARVMLAVKTVLTQSDSVPVLVFDEVDANIGGRTAVTVAEELRAIAACHQVLSVTHLPQIAAAGDLHFRVCKSVHDGRTTTSLEQLSETGREEELVRMLGGEPGSVAAHTHARELLLQALT